MASILSKFSGFVNSSYSQLLLKLIVSVGVCMYVRTYVSIVVDSTWFLSLCELTGMVSLVS